MAKIEVSSCSWQCIRYPADKTIRANLLTVQFIEDINGNLTAKQIDAQGGVLITTPSEVIVGNEGVYNVIDELVTLSGNVKITRGENQLNGSMAEVNLQSGASRLISDKSLGGTKRSVDFSFLKRNRLNERS